MEAPPPMSEPATLDYTSEIKALAELAARPQALDDLLDRALAALGELIPYDLAAVLELEGGELRVRAARGPLAGPSVRRHHLALKAFPTIRRAMETRRPVAPLAHDHSSLEGDPYDGVLDLPEGHACMIVPLFAGDRDLGVITLDRTECGPYAPHSVQLAGVYGQIVGLAILYAQQARVLADYRGRLEEQNRLLAREAGWADDPGALLEASRAPAMQRLCRLARQVAATEAPVLIRGETGVGKEVLAQAIHHWSPRRARPFVKLNCAAIPAALIESELFGHVKGAFTGAGQARPGRFLTANGGTLLLDEIGDLPLEAQAKLLRVLQSGTFEAVGSDQTVRVDVRMLAATHVDLEAAVRAGRFREDLFYRLEVFPLEIPSLRDRSEDIPALARQVLDELAAGSGRGPWTLPQDTLALLSSRTWPGNVRQLRNALERATILRMSGALRPEDFQLRGEAALPAPRLEAPATLDEVARAHIAAVLRHTQGRLYGPDGAAAILGLKPSTLQSRMKKLGIERLENLE
jgi:transcriptional regulator with GAF, ATPase, and Fis domain